MGWIASTSARSILAVDASPSGPKNGCLAVPGLTPFAGRLRPVGAVGFGIVEVASAPLGRRCVPFRAEKRLRRCTRAHALRWQITPRWGCRTRNFRGPPTHQLPCRWRHSIELPPCLDRLHRCTCISSLLQRFDIPFLRTVRFDLRLQDQMHPAPTGRNLPAKGVSPGTAEQAWPVPEGDASTAILDLQCVPGKPISEGFVPG